MPFLVTVVVGLAVLALIAVIGFNSLVKRRNRTGEAWSQIDVELNAAMT